MVALKILYRFVMAGQIALVLSSDAFAEAAVQNWRPKARWRGGNLFGLLLYNHPSSANGYEEREFAHLEKSGFNFVRLPIDYRFLAKKDGTWYQPDDAEARKLDLGVEYGRKHHLHVQVCFHRIPGYTVAGYDPEKHDLFKDKEALDAACRYWAFLARRYKGISNDELSFNLFNEPSALSGGGSGRYAAAESRYPAVIRALIKAIRTEDPERFIVADGYGYGPRGYLPVRGLEDIPNFGWATRGYEPMLVSHCGAKWVGLENSPIPDWPFDPEAPIGVFSQMDRANDYAPFELLDLPPCTVSFSFGNGVATRAELQATADGQVVKTETLVPVQGAPGWSNVRIDKMWKNAVGSYTGRVEIVLAKGAKVFSMSTVRGEWARPDSCFITSADGCHSVRIGFASQFVKPENFRQKFRGWDSPKAFRPVDSNGGDIPRRYADDAREYLYRTQFRYLDEVMPKGGFVMAGEFGVYNKTPHAMALNLLEAYFKMWEERKMGWAVWGFRGSMGVVDSERKDVDYEVTPDGKLDREMYELFKKY